MRVLSGRADDMIGGAWISLKTILATNGGEVVSVDSSADLATAANCA